MEKLLELGFIQSATTEVLNDNLFIKIQNNENTTNLLYAFVLINGDETENWHVRYIGHTRKSFKNRMYGYQQGNGKAVNNRIHNEVKIKCLEEKKVVVYTLSNIVNLNLHSLYIDIAAGLEYSLIEYYKEYNHKNNHPPLQNIAGNNMNTYIETKMNEIIEIEEKIEEDATYTKETIDLNSENTYASFEQNLSKATYWDSTYINIPIKLADYFGNSTETVTLIIVSNNSIIKKFSLPINRTANTTGSPRLYIPGIDGEWYQNWKHKNFNQKSSILFEIIGKNRIRINKNV